MGLSDNGLGRSVSDVLAKTVRRSPEPNRGYLEIDIGLISPSRSNPRKAFDQASLDELAASIRLHGILQPIVVLKREVGYEIISGERRYRAARQIGLPRIPVVIRDEANPQHLAEVRLVENIQRQDLNPIELAEAYLALLETHQLTQEELAVRINKDRASISNLLRLLTLPAALRQLVASGQVSIGHAKALLACTDPAWQVALAQRVVAESLSVRETERLAAAGVPTTPAPTAPASHVRELETNLYHLFGAPVVIRERGGKGTMTIQFAGSDQFQRVVAILERAVKQSTASTEHRPGTP